jgi:hypothetical protein
MGNWGFLGFVHGDRHFPPWYPLVYSTICWVDESIWVILGSIPSRSTTRSHSSLRFGWPRAGLGAALGHTLSCERLPHFPYFAHPHGVLPLGLLFCGMYRYPFCCLLGFCFSIGDSDDHPATYEERRKRNTVVKRPESGRVLPPRLLKGWDVA